MSQAHSRTSVWTEKKNKKPNAVFVFSALTSAKWLCWHYGGNTVGFQEHQPWSRDVWVPVPAPSICPCGTRASRPSLGASVFSETRGGQFGIQGLRFPQGVNNSFWPSDFSVYYLLLIMVAWSETVLPIFQMSKQKLTNIDWRKVPVGKAAELKWSGASVSLSGPFTCTPRCLENMATNEHHGD